MENLLLFAAQPRRHLMVMKISAVVLGTQAYALIANGFNWFNLIIAVFAAGLVGFSQGMVEEHLPRFSK